MGKQRIFILAVVAIILTTLGVFAYRESARAPEPGEVPVNAGQQPEPSDDGSARFGEAVTLNVEQAQRWSGGLSVRLVRIDDSRCQPGVVCIWQGELAATLSVIGGSAGTDEREIRLGTETGRRVVAGGYEFQLVSATETSVTIIVKQLEALAPGPNDDKIRATNPRPGDMITSPLRIEGEARGTWYFEASFPVELLDGNGKRIAQHYAQAQGEWMTESFVPFVSVLEFKKPATAEGTLVLHKDNPSGLPEHDDSISIPVRFSDVEKVTGTCKPSGCSGQVCSDQEVMTTCEFREEYACYKTATCARQADGKCGWTPSAALTACLGAAR